MAAYQTLTNVTSLAAMTPLLPNVSLAWSIKIVTDSSGTEWYIG